MARRTNRQGIALWMNFIVLLLFIIGLWIIGLLRFVGEIPDSIHDVSSRTDAIVVLTGGSGRLDAGLLLLSNNGAERMFVSGVYQGLDVRNLLMAARRDPTGLESRIGIGNAINTRENARETAIWVRLNNIESIRLVTAAYHMPRSKLEFEHALLNVKIIPNAVFPAHVKQTEWWAWPGTTALLVGEFNKYLIYLIHF